MDNSIKKVTKVMKFDAITAMLKGEVPAIEFSAQDAIDFLANERAMVVAKNARKSTTESKTQKLNATLLDPVYNALAEYPDGVQCKELIKTLDSADIATTQKLSTLLKQLINAGRAEKFTEKGVTKYRAIEVEG